MNNVDARKTLWQRQQALVARLSALDEHLLRKAGAPQEDSDERDTMLEQLALHTTKELLHVQHVLKKLGGPAPGICSQCGERIGRQRLTAYPGTRLCLDCVSGAH